LAREKGQTEERAEIVVREALAEGMDFRAWRDVFPQEEVMPLADPTQAAIEIVAGILSATSPEQVLKRRETYSSRDLVGVPLEIRGYRVFNSAFESGPRVFFACDARRLDTGEEIIVTSGAANILAQLVALRKLGALPAKVRVATTAKPTRQGYYPLWLEPA
jgi:hypothetical protein